MPDEYKNEYRNLLLSYKPANEHTNVHFLGIDTGMKYFGPDNETNVYTVREMKMPQYDIYARRHDLDVESALRIKSLADRELALYRADEVFMRNMDKIAWKYPQHWVASRVFKTGIQFQHYRKFYNGEPYVSVQKKYIR